MFELYETVRPESVGVPSRVITEMISSLERHGAAMHGVLFMRRGKICAEGYWAPFNRDFCHRMYSQTKSFVSIAIGLLCEEGKLSLDAKIVDFFPEKLDAPPDRFLAEQTVRDMLMMTTGVVARNWFRSSDPDRTHEYLSRPASTHPAGTGWADDSGGSQVLCTLVEKLAGKSLLAYLREKLFDRMGCFGTAEVLKTRNEDSWGDSAMVCTLRDIAAFGDLVMHYGMWRGERLMNEAYLREATSRLSDNRADWVTSAYHQGYGYQIWRVLGGGFAFVGMGDQLTVCFPEKDLLFACTADNQGTQLFREEIFTTLAEKILPALSDEPLPAAPEDSAALGTLLAGLRLRHAAGAADAPIRKAIDRREYLCSENPMGVRRFCFDFSRGVFRYTNAQGEKEIAFGVGENAFGCFPQEGYSDGHGGVHACNGFLYRCAASLAFPDDRSLVLEVRVIDRYFGNLTMLFSFRGEWAYATFVKTAEDFFDEYQGSMTARAAEKTD